MRYMATMYVSDVMEQIALTVEVQGWTEQYGPPETVCQHTMVWDGIGETDADEWLSKALEEALRQMRNGRPRAGRPAVRQGGAHTLSGLGDMHQDTASVDGGGWGGPDLVPSGGEATPQEAGIPARSESPGT